jgi:hypothetical protein
MDDLDILNIKKGGYSMYNTSSRLINRFTQESLGGDSFLQADDSDKTHGQKHHCGRLRNGSGNGG